MSTTEPIDPPASSIGGWQRVVDHAKAEVERMDRCPDGCGHVICGLSDKPIGPGETVTYELVSGGATDAPGHNDAIKSPVVVDGRPVAKWLLEKDTWAGETREVR